MICVFQSLGLLMNEILLYVDVCVRGRHKEISVPHASYTHYSAKRIPASSSLVLLRLLNEGILQFLLSMSHPVFLREVQGIDDTLHLSEKSGGKRECAKQRRK